VRPASADASFRRYLRIDGAQGSRIIMDAPPDKEDCRPSSRSPQLMADAGLHVPRVLAWDEPQGFMLLDDLGRQTMIEVIDPQQPAANLPLYLRAVDALIAWQLASRPGVLPAYDEALLQRELALFPTGTSGSTAASRSTAQRETLDAQFRLIVAQPGRAQRVRAPRLHAAQPDDAADGRRTALGVLDFQDAVHGPITYDIASLMRDAFLSWDEEFVLDVTVRYWQKARKAGPAGGRRLRRVLPRRRVDGPAAAPEGGRHLRPADAARRQAEVPGRHAALHRLHPRHRQPLPRARAAAARLVDESRARSAVAATPSAASEPVPRLHCPEPLAGKGAQLALPPAPRATCRCCGCSPARR
jgi:hypothetical protein